MHQGQGPDQCPQNQKPSKRQATAKNPAPYGRHQELGEHKPATGETAYQLARQELFTGQKS